MNDSDRAVRSWCSTPPPFSQTARRHSSPVRIAYAHSARLRADTSRAYVISRTYSSRLVSGDRFAYHPRFLAWQNTAPAIASSATAARPPSSNVINLRIRAPRGGGVGACPFIDATDGGGEALAGAQQVVEVGGQVGR
jgi:hypothetical protein